MGATSKPSFQFYPGDWMKDPALRRCTPAARGVWMDVICLAHECPDRGRFITSGVAWPLDDIGRSLSGDLCDNLCALNELFTKGVLKRGDDGVYFVSRMVRDEIKSRLCSEAGERGGGNPEWKNKGSAKGGGKGSAKGGTKRNTKASSSTSSSTSFSDSTSSSEESRVSSETLDTADVPGDEVDHDDPVATVFAHYRRHHPKRFPKIHSGLREWKLVKDRIERDGFTVMQLCDAIDGCHVSPHHMGQNERQTRYDALELIVRDAKHVQDFIGHFERQGEPVLTGKTQRTMRAAQQFAESWIEEGETNGVD